MPETLDDWLARLERSHPVAIDMTLDRVQRVRDALGLEFAVPVVVVAGTNGKGSTGAMLESMLRAAGLRVGLYSKPHLLHFEERCRIDGRMVSADQLVLQFEAVERARATTTLTYFEHTTLAILRALCQAPIDLAILEVGLGGRLDAVNVIDADCAVITGIDVDHTEYLGPDRESIAKEKAGILRRGKMAIMGDLDPPASLLQAARESGARVSLARRDFDWVQRAVDIWDWRGRSGSRLGLPRPSLAGPFQLQNASTALATIAALVAAGSIPPVADASVAVGLRTVCLPGRFQRLQESPQIVVDVAHNRQAASALADNLRMAPVGGATRAVFGCMRDKDVPAILNAVLDQVCELHLTDLPIPRAAAAKELEALTPTGCSTSTRAWRNVEEALNASLAASGPADRVLVFGSFHTVSAALQWHRALR